MTFVHDACGAGSFYGAIRLIAAVASLLERAFGARQII
eukprot:CAMPEP_0204579216 /NCGR_PEP_ID=MMETSP0661-20131031/43366_1 /ASSEMBLY_ACC=CAM_ASM_000606 /TAXON_ID=109239 /ORGANISM="Alexandrium margalefi, Strain AMGDE01CS-322" /LENGTH=37 /DNA_ID= /DNA_START= /DNA_END= /DNA_ORIENTATION=